MSRSKKSAKRKREASPHAAQTVSAETSHLEAVVSGEEIEVTVDTLRALSQHPNAIKSKGCRELRTAVYDFRQACTTGLNTNG